MGPHLQQRSGIESVVCDEIPLQTFMGVLDIVQGQTDMLLGRPDREQDQLQDVLAFHVIPRLKLRLSISKWHTSKILVSIRPLNAVRRAWTARQ